MYILWQDRVFLFLLPSFFGRFVNVITDPANFHANGNNYMWKKFPIIIAIKDSLHNYSDKHFVFCLFFWFMTKLVDFTCFQIIDTSVMMSQHAVLSRVRAGNCLVSINLKPASENVNLKQRHKHINVIAIYWLTGTVVVEIRWFGQRR